ncbi:MAG: hypothetical protein ACRESZ_18230 [Methylococcales bacterium]
MVRDLLTGFVHEEWVSQCDFDSLEKVGGSYISDDLRDREDDAIWRIRWGRTNAVKLREWFIPAKLAPAIFQGNAGDSIKLGRPSFRQGMPESADYMDVFRFAIPGFWIPAICLPV